MNLFKKSNLVAALAATMIFASCSKDDNDVNIPNAEGEKAKVSLAFTLPTAMTRADQAATSDESTVNTISVFIFTADGTKADIGAFTPLAATDFQGTNPYENKKDIETLSGNKRIYVGINLPSSVNKEFAKEADLLATVENISTLAASKNFVMFSDVKAVELKGESTVTTNEVDIDVIRVAAKVVATKAKATFEAKWSSVPALEMTYTIADFGVFNDAIKSYVAPNYESTTLKTLIDDSDSSKGGIANVLNAFTDSYANGFKAVTTGLTDANSFYIAENAPLGISTYENTTFAYIRTYVHLNQSLALTADKKGVEWVTADYGSNGSNDGADGTDVWMFKIGGKTYMADDANYNDIVTNGIAIDVDDAYVYKKGYVYFPVYLNKEATNDYDVKRNQFVHVLVEGVKSIDGVFPGFPGKKDDPKIPTDPDDQDDPDNPDPYIPEEPVDGEKAWLKVKVTVKDWEYKLNSTILQ